MNFHLRVDNASPSQINVTLLVDDAACGLLNLPVPVYERLSRLLLLGGIKWGKGVSVQCDGYTMPTVRIGECEAREDNC